MASPTAQKVDQDSPDKAGENVTETPAVESMNVDKMSVEDDPSSSDSDDESDLEGAPGANGANGANGEERLSKALMLKEDGNALFKTQSYEKASRAYRRGITQIKSLNAANTGDPQVKATLLTLNNNLAMVYAKLGKWVMVRSVCNNALSVDGSSVKALYRRGLAWKNQGNSEKAKADFESCLAIDDKNRDARRELLEIKKKDERDKKAAKKAFGGAFGKVGEGGGLYDDKEEERKRKLREKREEEEREKKKAEEALKKRKADWENECVSRMSRSEPPISYDEWDKEKKSEEKKEKERIKKEKEAKKKAEKESESKRHHEKMKSKNSSSSNTNLSDDSDDEELILKNAKGYKTTSDGRKTSYFNNEMSNETKNLIGDITPKAITPNSLPPAPTTPEAITRASSSSTDASTWNKAGTWEEKDASQFCKDTLTDLLKSLSCTHENLTVAMKEVKSVDGDGSVAIVRGKKRYLFDLNVKCEFQVFVADDTDTEDPIAKGKIEIPDVSSTVEEGEWEVEISFSKGRNKPGAKAAGDFLVGKVKAACDDFVRKFNDAY